MFYKTNIDITNDKQMFSFLKNHFTYSTMNSWNRLESIANNVKLHRLNLSGDWCVVYDLLNNGEYDNIQSMIEDWCYEHKGYRVHFNGSSNGYLVLYNNDDNDNILPCSVTESDDYSQYKEWCKYYGYTVKENRSELQWYTKLVRDFDKLCDDLRDYCDSLSKLKFEVVEMEKTVYDFNECYADDLELLGFEPLVCDSEGRVDCFDIRGLQCLFEAFLRTAARPDSSYKVAWTSDSIVYYTNN